MNSAITDVEGSVNLWLFNIFSGEVDESNFEVLNVISRGAFGNVYKVQQQQFLSETMLHEFGNNRRFLLILLQLLL